LTVLILNYQKRFNDSLRTIL